MTNAPGPIISFEEDQRLEAAHIDNALLHLRLEAVLRGDIGRAFVRSERMGDHAAVRKGDGLELLHLRPQVVIPVVGPAPVHTAAFEDGDVWVVKDPQSVEALGVKSLVVGGQKTLNVGGVVRRLRRHGEAEGQCEQQGEVSFHCLLRS